MSEYEVAHVKPDFLISTPTKTLVLEVAGSHEESYIERKKRTQDQMSQLGKVFEFDALQADLDKQFDDRLKGFLKAVSRELFAV